MQNETLANWHSIYARRITVWVLPLMFGQYFIYAYLVYTNFNWLIGLSATLVAFSSFITFVKAVPLHAIINEQKQDEVTFQRLLIWNLFRTISWTLVFLIAAATLLL